MKKIIMLSIAVLTVSALTMRKFLKAGQIPGLQNPSPGDQYGW